MNAAARVMYKMSQDGLLHRSLAQAHATNATPHVAVMVSTGCSMTIALVLGLFKFPLMDIVGWLGTLGTFGFIYAYLVTSLSAAKMLKCINQLTWVKGAVAAASVCVLAVSLIGSLYPAPPAPYNILPFIFVVYMLAGWLRNRALKDVSG